MINLEVPVLNLKANVVQLTFLFPALTAASHPQSLITCSYAKAEGANSIIEPFSRDRISFMHHTEKMYNIIQPRKGVEVITP